jgi:hypothetical protein
MKRTNMKKMRIIATKILFGVMILWVPFIGYAEESFKVIDDPATAQALKKFNQEMRKIMAKCPSSDPKKQDFTKDLECFCDHLPEIVAVIHIRMAAFENLLERRPDLINKMVKIKGVFGNYYLNPEDRQKDILADLKRRYRCK